MHERGLGGNDSFNWIWCTAFDSYNCLHANGEYVLTSDLFILFLSTTTTHYVWLRGRTLVDCIMVDRGADWHRAHLSRIPNDSSHEYHPPRKKHLFQIGIVELKLYRESWTFGEISLFVMFSGGFCEAYQLSRVQTTKVQFTASLLCNPFWERGQALKWKRMHQKTVCFTELLHRLDVAMLIELPVTIVTSPACIRIIWYISYIYICICIIW